MDKSIKSVRCHPPDRSRDSLRALTSSTARLTVQLDRLKISNGRFQWNGDTFRISEDGTQPAEQDSCQKLER